MLARLMPSNWAARSPFVAAGVVALALPWAAANLDTFYWFENGQAAKPGVRLIPWHESQRFPVSPVVAALLLLVASLALIGLRRRKKVGEDLAVPMVGLAFGTAYCTVTAVERAIASQDELTGTTARQATVYAVFGGLYLAAALVAAWRRRRRHGLILDQREAAQIGTMLVVTTFIVGVGQVFAFQPHSAARSSAIGSALMFLAAVGAVTAAALWWWDRKDPEGLILPGPTAQAALRLGKAYALLLAAANLCGWLGFKGKWVEYAGSPAFGQAVVFAVLAAFFGGIAWMNRSLW